MRGNRHQRDAEANAHADRGARILRAPAPATPADLAIINDRHALETLAPEDVYTFRGVISTDAVDSYFTHMDTKTTLPNFVEDFTAGTALQDSHNTWETEDTLGRSFRAVLEAIPAGEEVLGATGEPTTKRVTVDWYLVRNPEDPTDPVERAIRKLRGGTLAEMSVGFGGPDLRILCDEDGSDLWDWSSQFYPGMRLKDRVVTYTVFDARALEGSPVYKGATPGNGTVKERIQALATAGQIAPQEAERLGGLWGCRFALPARTQAVAGGRPLALFGGTARQEAGMARNLADTLARKGAKLSKATREKIAAAAGKSGEVRDDLEALIADVVEDVAEDEDRSVARVALPAAQVREVYGDGFDPENGAAILQDLKAGRTYRDALVERAVKAKVAVKGDGFDGDAYRARLERWAGAGDLAAVEEEVAEWEVRKAQTLRADRIVTLPASPGGGGPETDEDDPAAAGVTTIRSPFDEVPG